MWSPPGTTDSLLRYHLRVQARNNRIVAGPNPTPANGTLATAMIRNPDDPYFGLVSFRASGETILGFPGTEPNERLMACGPRRSNSAAFGATRKTQQEDGDCVTEEGGDLRPRFGADSWASARGHGERCS